MSEATPVARRAGQCRPRRRSRRGARPSTPVPSRIHLAAFPPKERWDDWVELDSRAWPERVERRSMLVPTTCFNCESACGLLAYVDPDTLQRPQVRGEPRAPRLPGPQLRQGAGHPQPGDRPRPGARPAAPGRGPGRAGWEPVSLGRGPRRHRRPHPAGHPGRTGRTRSCTTSAGRARTASPSGYWPPGGSTGTTRTPTSAPAGRAPATPSGWGSTGPAPTTPTPSVIFLISAHLESGHYFNPHAQRVMEAKAARRQARRASTPACPTPPPTPTGGCRPSPGQRGGHQPGHRPPRHRRPAATTASSSAGGGTGRSTWPPSIPSAARTLRGLRGDSGRALRRVHLRVRRRRDRAWPPHADRRGGRGGGRRRHPAVDPQLALGGGREPGRLAGVPHPVPAQRPPRGGGHAGRHLPQRLEQVRSPPDPHARPTARRGTS